MTKSDQDDSGVTQSEYCYNCERYVSANSGFHPENGPTEFCPHCQENTIFESQAAFYRNRIRMVSGSCGHEVLKVESGNGHHWIRYDSDDEEFFAVYEGPHGPENREATISHANIMTLLRAADGFSVEMADDTPFDNLEVQR